MRPLGHHLLLHHLLLLLILSLLMHGDMLLKDLFRHWAQRVIRRCFHKVLMPGNVSSVIVKRIDWQRFALTKTLILTIDLLLILTQLINQSLKATDIPILQEPRKVLTLQRLTRLNKERQ